MAEPTKIGNKVDGLKSETRAMLERMYRQHQANVKMLQDRGYKLCVSCRSVWIEGTTARKQCAVCEHNLREGRVLCRECRSVWMKTGDICLSCQTAKSRNVNR